MNAYAYLGIAIVSEVIGSTFLKLSDGYSKIPHTVAMVVAYGGSFYALAQTLKTLPLGIAYATWAGLGMVLTSGIGWFVFKQKLDLAAFCGLTLIIAGTLILNLMSKSSGH